MRHNWLGALVVALALAVQACLHGVGKSDGAHPQLPVHDERYSGACLLGQVCCNGMASLEAKPDHVEAALARWSWLTWAVAAPVLWGTRREYSPQARAPPIFS